MAKYRRKPIDVEAVQWFPGMDVPGVHHFPKMQALSEAWFVETIHGQRAWLAPGDYVVTEPDGLHHYPCKPDIFEARHDLVKE